MSLGFKNKKSIEYWKMNDYVEVRLKNHNETIDVQHFDINSDAGQKKFYQYMVQKLNINFKKISRELNTDLSLIHI